VVVVVVVSLRCDRERRRRRRGWFCTSLSRFEEGEVTREKGAWDGGSLNGSVSGDACVRIV